MSHLPQRSHVPKLGVDRHARVPLLLQPAAALYFTAWNALVTRIKAQRHRDVLTTSLTAVGVNSVDTYDSWTTGVNAKRRKIAPTLEQLQTGEAR